MILFIFEATGEDDGTKNNTTLLLLHNIDPLQCPIQGIIRQWQLILIFVGYDFHFLQLMLW
jgi:hypothetical protein